jgi:hypothetical protein
MSVTPVSIVKLCGMEVNLDRVSSLATKLTAGAELSIAEQLDLIMELNTLLVIARVKGVPV